MKTRKALITILILALLVVYFLTGMNYLKERDQKEELAAQISGANAALSLIPPPPADLDEQLSDAQDSLELEKETLIIDTNITRLINSILRLADEIGVKAIPLSTQPWILEHVSNQDYAVFRIDVEVSGNYSQMVSFMSRLESGEPDTLVLEHLAVEKVTGSFLLESPVEGPVNANIRITVYAHPATIK
ncbi:MAG: hypothetical protein A2Z15_01525 [Chloroflexi bacterium RBG_16_50_11]|nr:MAG: hypothetical protein A2Z15_01525 [Chloroflexi bacterium RBG_16_50_11]